jgi:hypothetical protein
MHAQARMRIFARFSLHVLLSCILAEQKQFCCNPPCRDTVLQRTLVDAVWTCEVNSKSFLLVVKAFTISVMVNLGQLKPNLHQNFL